MNVRIFRLGGSGARQIELSAGATVADAAQAADLPTSGHTISVNGLGAALNTALSDGDTVSLVPKVEAGSL